jgi:peptidyl-Asp metalloendopeptidase
MRLSLRMSRLVAVSSLSAGFVATAFAVTSGTAVAAGLFDPATAIEMRAAPVAAGTMRDSLRGAGDGSLRNRLVSLNVNELARVVPAGADHAENRLERARALNGSVTLDLFPGVSVTAQRTDIHTPDDGGYVWVGRGGAARPGWVTLVIKQNEVLGQIQTGGRLYRIEPVSGNLHKVIEINQNEIRDDMHLTALPELQKKAEADLAAPLAVTTTTTTINVMVAHTVNARLELGTAARMQARINLAIALANQAFANSGVYVRFARVGGENEINYDETAYYGGPNANDNYIGALCDLTGVGCSSIGVSNSRTERFSGLRSKRNAVRADLVVLMRKQGSYCGISWIVDSPTSSSADRAFSVVTSSRNRYCIEGNLLAHETGHNMGLQHDRAQYKSETGNSPSMSKINFGYVDKVARFLDIMGYRSSCGSACTRLPYFSTPEKTDPTTGRPLGIPQNSPGAADAVRTLNATRATIAGFR